MSDDRHPWSHEKRIRLTDQQIARLFLERHGCCRECGRKLTARCQYIIEHIVALECGGTNDFDNLGLTCTWCKPQKDAKDHAQAGKQRRTATKHLVPNSLRRKSALSKKPGTKYDWNRGGYVREQND